MQRMQSLSKTSRVSCAVFALLLLAGVALACQVPVFRFALERWQPDFYEVVVTTPGPLGAEDEEVLSYLRNSSSTTGVAANIRLTVNPPASETELVPPHQSERPRMRLFYPRVLRRFLSEPVWEGDLTMDNARSLIGSPVRNEIVKRILAGESAAWILVESGHVEKDAAAEETIRESSRKAMEILEVPEGVIGPGQVESPQYLSPSDRENVLESEIPLKIDFSVIRLSRADPKEEILLKILLTVEDDLGEYADQPMAFPVFGRGRILEPLIGAGINTDNIMFASTYLCGACSCQVKEENPGIDLLIAADWETAVRGSEVVIDKVLPPLEGPGALVQPAVAAAALAPASASASAPDPDRDAEVASDPEASPAGAPQPEPEALQAEEQSEAAARGILLSPIAISGILLVFIFAGVILVTLKMKRSDA